MTLNETHWNQHALMNKIQSLLLLVVMGGFMLLLGFLLWDVEGIVILAIIGTVLILFNPRFTPGLIMQMYRAYPLTAQQAPLLHFAVDELSRRAHLTYAPTLYYIPSHIVNAFSVGNQNNACIGITHGLLQALNNEEIVGVLAHELGHIRNNDMSVMGLADMFSRVTSLLSLFGQILLVFNLPLIILAHFEINWFAIALLILSPNICALAQLGLSRTREYDADLNAARLTGHPEYLANALVKIEQIQGGWLERLFFPGRRIPEPSLLRSHPPTNERVRRLMALKIPETVVPMNYSVAGDSLARLLQSRQVRQKPKWHFYGIWH